MHRDLSLAVDAARDAALARKHDAQARDDASYDAALDAALATVNSRHQMRILFDQGDVLDRYLPRGLYDEGGSLLSLLADAIADAQPHNSAGIAARIRDIGERLARSLAATPLED